MQSVRKDRLTCLGVYKVTVSGYIVKVIQEKLIGAIFFETAHNEIGVKHLVIGINLIWFSINNQWFIEMHFPIISDNLSRKRAIMITVYPSLNFRL